MALQGLQGQIQTHFAPFRNVGDSYTSLGDYVVLEYTAASSACPQTVEIDIPASTSNPVIVQDIIHVVTKAFSVASSLEVGDGSTANLYLQVGDITPLSVNTVAFASDSLADFDALYLVDSKRIVVTVLSTDGVGQGLLIVKLLRLNVPLPKQTDSTMWQSNAGA